MPGRIMSQWVFFTAPKGSLKNNFAEMRRKYDVDSDDLREKSHSNPA